jgi:hypothetical protein
MSTRLLRRLLVAAAALLALIGTSNPAQARCVTVGADGVSHTACDLP